LDQWWNLIYIVPFGFGVMLVLLSVLGTGRRSGRHAARSSAAGRHSAAAGRGTARTNSAPKAGTAKVAARSGKGTGGAKGRWGRGGKRPRAGRQGQNWAEALHVQNIPPLMLLQNFLLFWGIFGWAVNQYFAAGSADPTRYMVSSLLLTGTVSLMLTLGISAVLSRFTPEDETYVITRHDLIGRAGEAVSAITDRMGSVYVRDERGTLHHITGRIQEDGEPIARGKSVLIIDYERSGDYYWVKEWSPGSPSPPDIDVDSASDVETEASLLTHMHRVSPAPLHAQTEKPYRAWRWLFGSNPPRSHAPSTV
jgi:hypothetical protein